MELVRETARPARALPAGAAGMTRAASAADATASVASAAIPPVFVCGSAVWFNSLPRHLCPQQAAVQSCDDEAALALIEQQLSQGSQRAVWITSRPFAAAALAQHSSKVVAVQLPSLSELAAALEQAQPQLLIVDGPRWTVAAIGNLVRTLARSR
jgi:hypothetical protein